MARFLIVSALVILLVAGCGGGGAAPGAGDSVSYDFGTVQIEGSSGLRQVQIDSPDSSPVLFTGYCGARITRLTEVGYERLAIASTRPATSSYDICTINEDGSGFQPLTTWPYGEFRPDYSPNGSRILFECEPAWGNSELYCMDADGSDIVRLTSSPGYDGQGTWSPDGTKIAFISNRTGDSDVWLMNADGSGQVDLLTAPTSQESAPRWSPDGRRIALVSGATGDDNIYTIFANGGYPVALTTDLGTDGAPAWSPDGRMIVFTSDRVGGTAQVYTMHPDGSDQTARTTAAGGCSGPRYAPDGVRIAYCASDDIMVMRLPSGHPESVTQGAGHNYYPVWCPAPGYVRSLVGPAHSDGGSEPPFGSARPLAIIGLGAEGLVEAVTVDVLATMWGSLSMEGIPNTGAALTGVRIEGTQIDTVREDCGRGFAPRVWSTPSPTGTKSVTIVFSASTGRITTVLASSTTALASARTAAAVSGDGLVLTGPFDAVWGADPDRNLAPAGAARVVLGAATGVPVRVER